MLDFPGSPIVGQQFTGPNGIFAWDGGKWTPAGVGASPFLPLSGGAMTGPITLVADPAAALQPVTLQYFNAHYAGGAGPYLPLSGGTVTGQTSFTGGAPTMRLSGAAGTYRTFRWETGGVARFAWGLDNSTETGTNNAGSNFVMTSMNDAGANLVTSFLTINRNTGRVALTNGITLSGVMGTGFAAGNTNGVWQSINFSGSTSLSPLSGFNQWTVNADTMAYTGQGLFLHGIFYNFGGTGFSGQRGGLYINMTQTGVVSGAGGAGGMVCAQMGVTVNNTFGGVAGANSGSVFGANIYNRVGSGATFMQGSVGLEIDVESATGSSYSYQTGMQVITTASHQQAAGIQATAYLIGGQTNSIGFDVGWALNGSQWAIQSGGTVFSCDWASDNPNFNVTRGIDFRPITFSGDIFAASAFAINSTGRVRVGAGYLDPAATGLTISADGAICTAGTLTAPVTATYAFDGNHYWADDPYGGIWELITGGSGSTTINSINLVKASYVKGTPPANPITLTPRTIAKRYAIGAITANLTWDTSRTTLALNPSGGSVTLPAATTIGSTTGPFLPLAGGTVTGAVTITAGGLLLGTSAGAGQNASFVSAAGNSRFLQWFTGGTGGSNLRWRVGGTSDAEGGSNAGTNWTIAAYDDTGASLGNALLITRATLGAAFAGTVRTPFLNMGGAAGGGLSTALSTTTGVPFSQSPLWVNYSFTGTNSGVNDQDFNTIIVNDNVAYSGSGQSNALKILQQPGANATRAGGIWSRVIQTAAPTSPFGFLTAITGSGQISYNCGGTSFATLSGASGSVNTFNTYTALASGATFIAGAKGYELDMNVQAGSSVGAKTGILIARLSTDVVAGAWNEDTAISIAGSGANAATGWDFMIGFGAPPSQIPYKTTATLIRAFEPQTPSTGQALAMWGIDFSGVTFSSGFAVSAGFLVDGSGNLTAQKISPGGFSLTPSGSTLTIDQTGRTATFTSIAAGGGGYTAGDKVTTANGGLYVITTVSSGVATAVTQLVPDVSASPPANPVATTATNNLAGSGNLFHVAGAGLTLNLSWSSVGGTIALVPSGGTVSHGGVTTFGSGAQNIMTITPGAAAANAVVITQSGTGGYNLQGTTTIGNSASQAALTITPGPATSNAVVLASTGTGGVTVAGISMATGAIGSAIVFSSTARFNGNVGFYNTAPVAKPTVSGAKGSNAALGSLMTALVALGLVTDTTTA